MRFVDREFVAPFHEVLELEPARVLENVRQGLRAFVGQTAFEQLAQSWVLWAAQNERLPFRPDSVGSHWSRRVQVDVVALNWQTRDLLLGECKWTAEAVSRDMVRELVEEKAPRVLADMAISAQDCNLHYALFGRRGFTPAATAEAQRAHVHLIDLARLDEDLSTPLPRA